MYYNQCLKRNLKIPALTNTASNALNNDRILYYRTFNQTWSDTGTVWAHPASGILVGSGFTTNKVSIFYGKHGGAAVFVGAELVYTIRYPNKNFFNDVQDQKIEYIAFAKDKYER